ncbi:hypothetical protein [Acidipila sp. EB88]|uniref:hypothetical protein n=1 Tax=Acidipila sp. EB88 TaxID=2305226 RepID=UPI000F5E74E5|nr:hypothetical protein [Acidipila sp. EB88]RRA47471.1 hypothetical protein D1Y84_03330 [Acidipila sp. EB88]
MRQALEHEHTLLEDEAPRNDLVLGAPALLGIFFALALICAVCFGFGYSSARTVHMPLQAGAGTASLPTVPTPESRSAAAAASSIPDDDTQDGTDNASNASMGSGGNAPRTTPGSSTLGATPPSTAAKPTPGTASTQQEYWPPVTPRRQGRHREVPRRNKRCRALPGRARVR